MSLIFWGILIQNWIEKTQHNQSKFREGARLLRPLWIRHWVSVMIVMMMILYDDDNDDDDDDYDNDDE